MLCSCGSVKNQVAVETGCPKENIKLISKSTNFFSQNATYAYDACGKRVVYKKVGSVYMRAEDAGSYAGQR